MKEENNSRKKWLHLRLTVEEETALRKSFSGTTELYMSDYARKILLGKPMIAAVRNQSLQDILAELLRLRKDLNGAANNFNQVVKKLHSMPANQDLKSWLLTFKLQEKALQKSVEEMRAYISKTADLWLQG